MMAPHGVTGEERSNDRNADTVSGSERHAMRWAEGRANRARGE
jgi:hypothetical protein